MESQVYIKKPPHAFMLFLKEQRPRVKAELKTRVSKDIVPTWEPWRVCALRCICIDEL